MSNLPKYRSTIEEHVKLSQQLLGIGGEALVEAPTEKIAAAGAGRHGSDARPGRSARVS